jgi:hypothetical protein
MVVKECMVGCCRLIPCPLQAWAPDNRGVHWRYACKQDWWLCLCRCKNMCWESGWDHHAPTCIHFINLMHVAPAQAPSSTPQAKG